MTNPTSSNPLEDAFSRLNISKDSKESKEAKQKEGKDAQGRNVSPKLEGDEKIKSVSDLAPPLLPSVSSSSSISSLTSSITSPPPTPTPIPSPFPRATPSPPQMPSSSTSSSGGKSATEKIKSDRLPPTNPAFRVLNLTEAADRISTMHAYCSSCHPSSAQRDQIKAIVEVLNRMLDQLEFAQFDTSFTFTEITCEGQMAGLLLTYFDSHRGEFFINDMVTAPWNVVPDTSGGHPPARGGIGPLLIQYADQTAAKVSKDRKLHLMSLNPESTKFYHSQNFTTIGSGYPLAMERPVRPIPGS